MLAKALGLRVPGSVAHAEVHTPKRHFSKFKCVCGAEVFDCLGNDGLLLWQQTNQPKSQKSKPEPYGK